MGSESPLKLPIVDFSKVDLIPGTPDWESVKLQVMEALVEYGCFEAVYNKVPLDIRKSLFNQLEQLFDLPLQRKFRNSSTKPFHGYVGQYPTVPLYESMGIEDAPILEKAEYFTNLMWPEGNEKFCNAVFSYSKQLSDLDHVVRRMVLESLGVEKYYKGHIENSNYLLRVMKYKGPQSSDTKMGLSPHTDKNIVTILGQNDVDGLEVQTKDGQWMGVKVSPESFIVMTGDSLLAWTNGRVHSAVHRVMMSGKEARYSTGLFSVPIAGYVVEAPEELVDEEYPLLYKPFDHVEFLSFYYTERGQRVKSALKAYAGIGYVEEN